ncbi:formate/nitrite transporter family protein [Pseudomonas zeshuii]|uniref:Formate/nitrite transporter family protein n=1 Tax=Pseudomonas luteola TaxID=47886 RepID=A0ABS0FTR3_PSELU|nr:formate/nitrite transporter family protein [Pseudomonas zeshuii]
MKRPALAFFFLVSQRRLDLGFGPLAMAINNTSLKDVLPPPILTLLNANFYAIRFVLIVIGYSALFTAQTTSAVQPVLARRASVGALFRLWSIVLVANLIGCFLFSAAAVVLEPALGVIEPSAFGELAHRLIGKPWWVTLMSAAAADWLMGLLSWLIAASRETTSQIIVVWLATVVIGLSGMHHFIAGTIEILMGYFPAKVPPG